MNNNNFARFVYLPQPQFRNNLNLAIILNDLTYDVGHLVHRSKFFPNSNQKQFSLFSLFIHHIRSFILYFLFILLGLLVWRRVELDKENEMRSRTITKKVRTTNKYRYFLFFLFLFTIHFSSNYNI